MKSEPSGLTLSWCEQLPRCRGARLADRDVHDVGVMGCRIIGQQHVEPIQKPSQVYGKVDDIALARTFHKMTCPVIARSDRRERRGNPLRCNDFRTDEIASSAAADSQ